MTRPRDQLISVADTPYCHVVSRCVRRTFLCGLDSGTGVSYEHRRQWIEERIRLLSSLFAIDLCAYAVMSNHYHLVVKLCPEQSKQWSDGEVLARWASLFKGPLLVQRFLAGEALHEAMEFEARYQDNRRAHLDRRRSAAWPSQSTANANARAWPGAPLGLFSAKSSGKPFIRH